MLRSLLSCLTISALSSVACGLTVHLITHTHDDVGWLKTVDQYYVGLHNEIQHAMVQFVLDTVVDELGRNPNRTFSYVEQAFFQRWWRQQDDATKEKVKGLVKSKQLEFVNGGWCMHDEATTHFVDMIDQTTYGHSFILEQFGEDALPTVNTQWDPFGHSATQGSLFGTAAGYDALFFGRMDHVDHDKRVNEKNLEFMWRPSRSQEASAQVFSFASLDGNYNPPSGLCFDYSCGDDPIQDDPRLNDYNLDQKVDIFVRAAMDYAAVTKGDLETMNVAFKMGSDFQYEAAHEWFINLDKLIDAVNRNGTVKAMYSTPRRFMEAKNAEPVTFDVKTDDFFPYSDAPSGYWTGYFTSRPALKRYVRVASNFLQIARHMEVFIGAPGNVSEALWEAQSLAQHHDAVSGTEKQAVAYDYAQRIARGAAIADQFIEDALASLVTHPDQGKPTFAYCPLANTTICDASANGNLVVVVYNPQGRSRNEIVFIPSATKQAKVVDGNGNTVASQILPAIVNAATTSESLPYRIAVNVTTPGLGFQTVFVMRSSSEVAETEVAPTRKHDMHTMSRKRRARAVPPHIAEREEQEHVQASPSIENAVLRLNFDPKTNLLTSITNKQTGETTPFAQDFAWYPAYQTPDPKLGWDSLDGAYVFRPNQQYANPLTDGVRLVSTNNGPLVSEAVQHVSAAVSQVIRLRQDYLIEFEWTVGPIDISDNQGKEIVIRYNTSLASKGQFYTDANGREFQPRVRNYRETFPFPNDQPISGNYYPITTGAYLTDGNEALVVTVDRAQGGSSIADGELEFMLHRRLCADDSKGVGEHLNEPGLDGKGLVVTGTHYVMLGPVHAATLLARQVQSRVYAEPHISYAQFNGDVSGYVKNHYTSLSFLQTNLPPQVELITAQVMPDTGIAPADSTLIRLAHMYGINEPLGQPVTFDLNTLVVSPITSIKELSLTAVREAGAFKPITWNVTDAGKTHEPVPLDGTMLTIGPNEVRTFVVTIGH